MRTLFEDAIDVPVWLDADRATPYAERAARDRGVAKQIATNDAVDRVRAWWRTVDRGDGTKLGRRLASGRAWVTFVLMLLAALFGAALAAAAFHYDGSEPVNVVRVLGVLVIPQLVLVLLTLLFAAGLFPGIGRLQIGAVAAQMYARVAGVPAGPMSGLFDWRRANSASARFARWQVLTWSQIAAVVFNLAVLATAAALIAFTDLAFGWSTTLDVDARTARTIVETLALPWRSWLPTAVPESALIEASRFFRLGNGIETIQPATLTRWWPFLLSSLLAYGLLPRVALLAVALQRHHAATRALLLDDAGVTALLDRMSAPAVALDGSGAEASGATHSTPSNAAPGRVAGQRASAIVWAGSVTLQDAAELVRGRLAISVDRVIEAGGGRSLTEDRAAIGSIGAESSAVVVLVRAFEPPLLELLDFLRALRERVSQTMSIIVLPVAADGDRLEPHFVEAWTTTVARLHDPATYVEAGA